MDKIFTWTRIRNYHLINFIPAMVALKLGHSLGHDVTNVLVVYEAVTLTMMVLFGGLRNHIVELNRSRVELPDSEADSDKVSTRQATEALLGGTFLLAIVAGWGSILGFGIWGF